MLSCSILILISRLWGLFLSLSEVRYIDIRGRQRFFKSCKINAWILPVSCSSLDFAFISYSPIPAADIHKAHLIQSTHHEVTKRKVTRRAIGSDRALIVNNDIAPRRPWFKDISTNYSVGVELNYVVSEHKI